MAKFRAIDPRRECTNLESGQRRYNIDNKRLQERLTRLGLWTTSLKLFNEAAAKVAKIHVPRSRLSRTSLHVFRALLRSAFSSRYVSIVLLLECSLTSASALFIVQSSHRPLVRRGKNGVAEAHSLLFFDLRSAMHRTQ